MHGAVQTPVAEVEGSGPTASANARLIAAAPDLLKALRAMIHIWDGGGDAFSRLQAVEDARTALAKAGL